jgi:hypothetical protein
MTCQQESDRLSFIMETRLDILVPNAQEQKRWLTSQKMRNASYVKKDATTCTWLSFMDTFV